MRTTSLGVVALWILMAGLAAPQGIAQESRAVGARPAFILGPILQASYDGQSDDLLTAGLGQAGLAGPPPPLGDPPTAAELRRLAIYTNYRALVDTAQGGGYGVFFGPAVGEGGTSLPNDGKIAGQEFLTFADGRQGTDHVTMLVQVPASFDPARPCIVTGPSSGSRGVYGAIGTSGEWGLKRGCAVTYTDKGTGTGAHDLSDGTVNLIDGTRADAETAGDRSNFTAPLRRREAARFIAETPGRFAFKHAHSRANPEAAWGQHVLQSIRFAFHVLNGISPQPITPANTIVIASSVSNGGGASVRAAEEDRAGLIDAVVVAEPNVNPRYDPRFTILQEGRSPLRLHSRKLFDYTTLVNLFQPCANALPALATAPLNFSPSPARCTALAARGLLSAPDVAAQAAEAQAIINDYGILPEQNIIQPSHWQLYVPQSIAVTYANAYGRFGVEDRLCGYGFGATDPASGQPVPLPAIAEARLFGTSNGIPPTGGVNLINERAPGGPREDRVSTPEQNLEGALCLRSLAVRGRGREEETGVAPRDRRRVRRGVAEIEASGDLAGRPAIFVTGRSDAILPPNHTSRAYYGLNQIEEKGRGSLRYYEVTNAQHLDALNGLDGYKQRFVPLHRYFLAALDLMYAHLREGRPLPASQVVHTVPRGGAVGGSVPDLALANVPPIAADPAAATRITFSDGTLRIPD